MEQVPELNLSNYDHDDVCDLNKWACEADAELTTLRQRAEAAERRVRELEGAVRKMAAVVAESIRREVISDAGCSMLGQGQVSDELVDTASAAWKRWKHLVEEAMKDPHAKAAIDAAGGEA